MEQKYVSVWVGESKTEDEFYKFTEFFFDEDVDEDDEYDGYKCEFVKEFCIDLNDIDEDFMEVYYTESLTSLYELLEGCSYYDSFKEQVKDNLLDSVKGDSVILLYDYKYQGSKKKKHGMTFVGLFEYKK